MQSTIKIKKDVYVTMEEGEEDYGQFCILDEEILKVEWIKPISHYKYQKTVYGLFEKTLYVASVVAIFILFLRNV